ncbi:MAG: site-specific integrase [Methanobacteriota archaeon]|nr:MAG: site-specific integrase [Euryarchaeota archaeon]
MIIHKKSLWDATALDVKKYLLQEGDAQARSILKTFYRVLIESGEFEGDNPVIILENIEEEERKHGIEQKDQVTTAETVLQSLNPEIDTQMIEDSKKPQPKKKLPKRIMTLADLEMLLKRTTHIREKAILEILFFTGARLKEIVDLNVSDVDLDGKKILFFENNQEISRAIAIPKRALPFLKLYERWRYRQLSPSNAYFITKKTKERMNVSTISTWLYRIQRDKEPEARWTATDFRKRAILQHYWLTKDLASVTRFAGYKRPEATLRVVNQILMDRGIETLDELANLPEFEELEKDRRKASTRLEEQSTTITINLTPDELEMIRKSGLTPTQAVKTVISLKDLYSAFAPVAAAPSTASSPLAAAMNVGKPGGMPSLGSSKSKPSKPLKPKGPGPSGPRPGPRPGPGPGPVGGGGGLSFLAELKSKLQARNKEQAEKKSEITVGPKDHFANVKIVDKDAPEEQKEESNQEEGKEENQS